MIWVVNFPFCNFFSLSRYFLKSLGPNSYSILSTDSVVSSADTIFLPGVGTFEQAMDYLSSTLLSNKIIKHASQGGKLIGICLGMQILLDSSLESPSVKGLGLIPGSCQIIPVTNSFPVPHIGWNTLQISSPIHPCYQPFVNPSGSSISDYYFVHSFHALPTCDSHISASFHHPEGMLTASIAHSNVFGFQFHPEKSGKAGYKLLDHLLSL